MRLLCTLLIAHLGLSPALLGEESLKNEANGITKVEKSDLVGKWKTVRFWGKDSGDFIERIILVFRNDGTFKATATLKGKGDSSYAGTYSIDGKELRMKAPNQPDQIAPCYLKGAMLVLGDSEADSWMELKRGTDAESLESPKKPKAEQDGTGQRATRPESDSQGNDKPQPNSEKRSK